MQKKPPFKKKAAKVSQSQPASGLGGVAFSRKKKLGYRTPDRFKRSLFRRKPVITTRPRSLGGHR